MAGTPPRRATAWGTPSKVERRVLRAALEASWQKREQRRRRAAAAESVCAVAVSSAPLCPANAWPGAQEMEGRQEYSKKTMSGGTCIVGLLGLASSSRGRGAPPLSFERSGHPDSLTLWMSSGSPAATCPWPGRTEPAPREESLARLASCCCSEAEVCAVAPHKSSSSCAALIVAESLACNCMFDRRVWKGASLSAACLNAFRKPS